MEVFKIAKVIDPTEGTEVHIYLTEQETQTLLQYALNYLVTLGAVSLSDSKDGVNIKDLDPSVTGKPN